MFAFLRKKRIKETGAQNAARFVATVTKLAEDERMVQLFPHPGFHGSKHERYGWEWMPNAAWRKEVNRLIAISKAPVKDARFHAPDSLDGWTFTAVSTTPLPRVAQLTLDDVL